MRKQPLTPIKHGTVWGYGGRGCRCDACRKAAIDYYREYDRRTGRHKPMAEWLAELAAREPPPHGTDSRYCNQGCRCGDCKRAHRVAHADYTHRVGLHKPWEEYLAALRADPPPHGTESRYSRPHKCRCSECREASRLGRLRRRSKNGAQTARSTGFSPPESLSGVASNTRRAE